MPTYDYFCSACNEMFEVFHSITAEPLKKCEKCGGKVERQIGAGAGLIFKGSGFYATDYKKSSPVSTGSEKKESKPAKPDSCSSSGPGCAKN